MITILYTYRNRNLERIKRSLDSLKKQSNQNFEVLFIDYGSEQDLALKVKELIANYNFAKYQYLFTQYQPWNKSKALNYAVKTINTDFCFNADVDMIFHPEFTAVLEKNKDINKLIYFQVGFLSEEESTKDLNFDDYKIKFLTNEEATGMTLFPVQKLRDIKGFDEFFHFWGSEDTDIHNRLKKLGCEIEFYKSKLLMLHQWHKNYRQRETQKLNLELQLSRVVELNSIHLKYNAENEKVIVNSQKWGELISESDFIELETFKDEVILKNESDVIDHFLFVQLPNFQNGILSVRFIQDDFQSTLKYKIKKATGKKVPNYYSLKEINDKVLLHIISFYHTHPYFYKISKDLKSITFRIKK
ncbi:galactosyltransferase-related protein [Flavobacterium johnsoniae]|uniref:glycosyltransferase family 2 protein n=1 Tax=Flavobacterium johnsoniae TaxID=986 RepID=UPI0025AF0D82|nr:galactosyltransferase-related protein [Flavobacterium johnsoniae]WJS95129.1 galactosyltransferase-related protein [Flavobacterium johnsoniae]